ncbi:MAG: adenylate/guanylate cyclase domain-containing protein [Rickettsiales bacterium]
MKLSWTLLIPISVLGLGVFLKVTNPPFLQALQLKVFDSYQAYQPRPYTEVPVSIVDIDEESLKKIGQWPWPRNQVAQLINQLKNAGVAAIALDIVFAEPDRTSPKQILPLWGEEKELKALLSKLPDHDAEFATAVSEANVATGFVLSGHAETQPDVKAGMAIQGSSPTEHIPPFDGTVNTLPAITDAARGNGALNSLPDLDGIIRRMPLVFNAHEKLVPGLMAEALRIAQGNPPLMIKSIPGAIEEIKIGDFIIPTDRNGSFWIHFTEPHPERYISAWKILENKVPQERLNGQIIFIGTSAAGLKDIRSSPLNPVMNGVEVHAQALEQVLLGHFLNRPDWMEGAEIVGLITCGIFLLILMQFIPPIYGAFAAMAAIAAAIYGSWMAFQNQHLLIEPVIASIVLVFVYLTESLRQFMLSEREKQQVRNAFSRYMSPALVERLAENPGALKLGGEMRQMTILFSDIRGFTTLSERYTAEELTRLINRFLTPMTDTILQHNGTIDKYMGDAIMAFWNAPIDNEKHARDACMAALDMEDRLRELNTIMQKESEQTGAPYHELAVGIGLNSGVCCVGNMGSEQRFDYSVLGDNVNLASRLEGQSKTYGVTSVLGENTVELLEGMAVLELDLIQVKGKTAAVRIFTLLGDEAFAAKPEFNQLKQAFDTMLAAYRAQQFAKAQEQLIKCRSCALASKIEGLLDLYEERLAEYTDTPPPADWDGVFVAKSK